MALYDLAQRVFLVMAVVLIVRPYGLLGRMQATVRSVAGPEDPIPAWDLDSLDWDHVDERLKAAVDDLRPEYRSILLLWSVEGLKYREIAEIQDIPIGTVMSRLHRARAILAHELADLAEEIGLQNR